MLKNIYLTIDDSPSKNTSKKIDFLKKNNIPTLFYLRGEHVEKYKNQAINIIENNFLIGNHSYLHPYFAKISFEECILEINKAEKLINDCYLQLNKKRDKKIIRFPFGDRGGDKQNQLQDFLKNNQFERLNFNKDNLIDSVWDIDVQDYKSKHIKDENLYLNFVKSLLENYKEETAVLLLHDFDNNHHLFELTMDILIKNKFKFKGFL